MSNQNGYFQDFEPWRSITTETINGQLMVKIPRFYVKYQSSPSPTWYVSGTAATGYEVHPAFIRGGSASNPTTMSCFYWGAYPSSDGTTATAPTSQSTWKTNMSLTTSKTACLARNTATTGGVNAGWHLPNIYEWMAIALLMTIEMGGPDMQTLISTSYGSGFGNGKAMDSKAIWRGLHCLYGQNWQWIDGLQQNANVIKLFNPYAPTVPTAAKGENGYSYTTLSSSYKLGPTGGGWWEGFQVDPSTANQFSQYCFLPKASAASETASATGDYLWSNTSSNRVCQMGGRSGDGSKCGMFSFHLRGDASYSDCDRGFRLAKYGDNMI